jgi:hypothetical protein
VLHIQDPAEAQAHAQNEDSLEAAVATFRQQCAANAPDALGLTLATYAFVVRCVSAA